MKPFEQLKSLIGFGKTETKVELTEEDFLTEAAVTISSVTGMDRDEARFVLSEVSRMGGDLQLIDDKIVVDLPGKHDEIVEFQKALHARHQATAPASELSNYDISELQEAARQASAMMGISEKQAMLRLMEIGRKSGKVSRGVKAPRARVHETKPCLLCGKDKQHSNSFCSGECARQYKKESVVKDRAGRVIRPGMIVEIMEGGDEGKLLTVAEVLPDSPCCKQPGYWVDCRDIGEDVLTSGIMSYMLEIRDEETECDTEE